MAERRMLSSKIICSDAFIDMPFSAQALYVQLVMEADDDGFLNRAKRIQGSIGSTADDLMLLLEKRFLLGFKNGVVVIKHWRIHNQIRKDRYNPTQYQDEFASLEIKADGAYTEKVTAEPGDSVATIWQPNGNQMATQVRLGKDSIGKGSTEEDMVPESDDSEQPVPTPEKLPRETIHTVFKRILPDYVLSDNLQTAVREWLTYKVERDETYKEMGLKKLLRQIENNAKLYGDDAVCTLIDDCMASNWAGIIFDRLKQKPVTQRQTGKQSSYTDSIKNRVSDVDNW